MLIKPFKITARAHRTITADAIEFKWRGNDVLIAPAWDCDSDGSVWSCASFFLNGVQFEPYEYFESVERDEEWIELEMEALDHRYFGWKPFPIEFLALLEEALIAHLNQLEKMEA